MTRTDESKWMAEWEKHIKAIQDMESMSGKKRVGAVMRAKNSYIGMYAADNISTAKIYPSGY